MKNHKKWRRLPYLAAVILAIFVLTAAAGLAIRHTFSEIRQREVQNILYFYSENMMLKLTGTLNEAKGLAQTAQAMEGGSFVWFDEAAERLLQNDEVRYVCLIVGDKVVQALPQSAYGNQVGRDLKDFSYVYTLAKVVKEFVVEGPILLDSDQNEQRVFLFLQPFVEEGMYLGEVIVALDSEYVLAQLGLDYLSQQGYDYELWRVNPQSGGKDVIAVSRDTVDFSYAAKTTFYLPTQWNLSVQPTDGWISPAHSRSIWMICIFMAIMLILAAYGLYMTKVQGSRLRQLALVDSQTGLYNRAGFAEALEKWSATGKGTSCLFYLVFEGYNQVSQRINIDEEQAFLQSIAQRLQEYIHSPFIAGRLGEENFILAVREDMNELQQEAFAQGLSLELLLKVRIDGERKFLKARYQYSRCHEGFQAEAEIAALINSYYKQLNKESPVQKLTEKCRQLIDGQSDVVFDEYTDLEMMELSKTFNQYRKKVEQLAYYDPMFNVGNRQKYFRDANMLISYDQKRQFSLFCIDICAFSQYNELFSADIGDRILQEVINRLSRLFGSYLYRINGDVFLGILLSEEGEQSFNDKLQQQLAVPVAVGNASFALQVRVVVCRYPTHGQTPDVLLDHIQAAIRFAKQSEQKLVIYNGQLDEMIRTEADILHRLKASIQDQTLEVWYQPMIQLKTGCFVAVEALVRLPNGKDGYFPAGQVIALAERSGMVEQLGDYVISKACHFMHSVGQLLGLERMGINLSVQQLLVGNSDVHLLQLIQAVGLAADKITLEITESVLIQSIESTSLVLEKLRQAGVHVALDDFGVGYSSLNYLSNLPVDVIKIDRSLTQQILTNAKQHALLRSIVEMAEINHLAVVAEGVETAEEEALIAQSGVQYIQGYYYAKPLPENEMIRFLESKGAQK